MRQVVKVLLRVLGRVPGFRWVWLGTARWILRSFALPLAWRDLILWPMATYILGEGYTAVVTLGTGPTLRATMDNPIGRLALFYCQSTRGFYEPQTLRLALRLQSPVGRTVIAGAHIGYHALHLAQAVQISGGAVYAFEPVQNYFEQLRHNRELSKLDNLITERLALASSSRPQVKLYLAGARSSVDVAANANGAYEYVETVSLHDYVLKHGIASVDLIFLDVEGSELNVLMGARHLLDSTPGLILEVNRFGLSQQGQSADALYEFLFARGYQLYIIADDYSLRMRDYDPSMIVLYPIGGDAPDFLPQAKAFNVLAIPQPNLLESPGIVIQKKPIGHRDQS